MAITVGVSDAQVIKPVEFKLIDRSGAHVILTVAIEGLPPITHAFDPQDGDTLVAPVDLPAGVYRCAFVVQAFKHAALNTMFACALTVNEQLAGSASGAIPAGQNFDVGSGPFKLTVA